MSQVFGRQGPNETLYDVALSFAREQRGYVEQVALACRRRNVKVFYDTFEAADLWGKNLVEHLDHVYASAARYCIIFISEEYARRAWCTHESRSAMERAFGQDSEYVLPVIFDDTRLPGVPSTVGYIDGRTTPPEELTTIVCEKLALASTGRQGNSKTRPVKQIGPSGAGLLANPKVHNEINGLVGGDAVQIGHLNVDRFR